MSIRVREAIARAAAEFRDGIEAALFTTFTFDPGFFEANVLPTLFGVETRGVGARRAEVNARLAGIPIAVFYDAAALSGSGGEYQYQTWAVRLPGAGEASQKGPYFHPKLVLLAGRYEHDGEIYPVVYLNCGSANLTLSGWGHNLEALGETWIDDADAPAQAELLRFLHWLQKVPRSIEAECLAIEAILRVMEEMRGFGGENRPELHVGGIGPHEQTFAERLRLGQTRKWDCLTVLSPYWSGCEKLPALIDRFRVKEVRLVPGANRDGAYGLTQDHLSGLKGLDVSTFTLKETEPNRFAHAKLYALSKKHGSRLRVAVGSCNMTAAAHEGNGGNVEAMLIYSLDLKKHAKRALPDLQSLQLAETQPTDETDDPPDSLPFDLTLLFDWKDRAYAVWFSGPPADCADVVLHLPKADTTADVVPLCEACANRRIACPDGPGKARGFRVTFTRNGELVSIAGLFSEINLCHSTRNYVPSLSAAEIIEELRVRSSGLNQCLERHRLFDEGDDDAEAATLPAPPLNLYDFYVTVHGERWRALKRRADKQERAQRLADLVGGPASLLRLARAVVGDDFTPVHRFAVTLEVYRVLQTNRKLLDDDHLVQIEDLLTRSRASVKAEIAEHAGEDAPGTPDELLDWFEAELDSCSE